MLKDRLSLRFDGVESAMALWVNGRFAGYSEDSFTPEEFDITELVCEGENKLAAEVAAMETDEEKAAEAEEQKESGKAFGELAPDVRRSLWLILFSVAFWFMGYNAVTSAFTRYMQVQWGYDIKAASQCLMVATVGAVLSYLPVGMLSSKVGRK